MKTEEGSKRISESLRASTHDVRQSFAKMGYKPLFNDSDYINNRTKLKYKCPKHGEQLGTYSDISQKHGCKKCASELVGEKCRLDEKYVFDKFKELGLHVLDNEVYINATTPIKYICDKHPVEIQEKKWIDLREGCGCPLCAIENSRGENSIHWQGGRTPIFEYLRKKISQWKKDSMEKCEYKCVITGERFDVIHHLYNFHKIAEETFDSVKIEIKPMVEDYSAQELVKLEQRCLELHYKYGLGVCLKDEVHKEFHNIYGKEDNTPEQFDEFKEKYSLVNH